MKIHGSNVRERLDGEIERRADAVGILPDGAPNRRPAGALLTELNDVHTLWKRCTSLESSATISGNPPIDFRRRQRRPKGREQPE